MILIYLRTLERSEYILNANLEVLDDVGFAMTSNQDGLQYLKIIGANGIIVYGKILINGVKITSWDIQMRTLSNKTLMALSDVAMCNLLQAKVLR